MRRTRPITAFGWAVKKRLAERKLDQKEFCRRYGIPEYRLSNLISGTRKAEKYRKQVAELLGIEERESSG
ncbi:XRE family transcriptional regulator [Cohnella caldifontis]|uniref:XRE family transcriptional regulator n=1 Tax=Cohnella caldifontis TaxID=3027471 RepID=UPI0023ED1D19|nr:XRE family transcriptional regulator [Cohnella sp. YIM B05605]